MTDSLFSAGGLNTPPSSQFLPITRFDWKNCTHSGSSVTLSQANGIFLQSQTDYVSGGSSVTKKTETCFGRWAQSRLEPLHIQVPPLYPVTNLAIKTENISCGSSRSSKFDELLTPQPAHQNQTIQTPSYQDSPQPAHQNSLNRSDKVNLGYSGGNGGGGGGGGLITTMAFNSPSKFCQSSSNEITNGCSRTIPVSWSAPIVAAAISSNSVPSSTSSAILGLSGGGGGGCGSSQSPFIDSPTQQHHAGGGVAPSSSVSSSSSLTVLQIKREPCQVSEVTTSNNLGHHHQHHQQQQQHHSNHQHRVPPTLAAVVKIESSSPKSSIMESHSQNTANAIPVGIAVARQRLQEHTSTSHQHQSKEINRFGIGITDIGGGTSSVSQNMFFAGTNSAMIPLNSDSLTLGVSNVQNAVRTPPTFWQYPTSVPVESMLPMPVPPVGFQLVRDPSTGQLLFLPATTAIEPFQSAVVWPTYSQSAAAIQQPHLLLPPITQSLQPPPLAPLQLLGSDYLATASTTLHQHTQTHSTRFVALTADAKRKPLSSAGLPSGLPVPHHAVIKIEDCGNGNTNSAHHHHHHHNQAATAIFGGDEKTHHSSLNTSSTSAVTGNQTNDISSNVPAPQLFYHQPSGGLIQIAHHNSQSNAITDCRSVANETSPSLLMPQILSTSSPQLTSLDETGTTSESMEPSKNFIPEVQDATIQTDTPVMSEDDNTIGADDCSLPTNQMDEEKDVVIPSSTTLSEHLSPPLACHDVSTNLLEEEKESPGSDDVNSSKNDSGFGSNAVTSTNSLEEASSITEDINSNVTPNTEENQFSQTSVDLSGLELLSNISIEAFEKKTIACIKKEPPEDKSSCCPYDNKEESDLNANRKENEEKHLNLITNGEYVSDQNEQLGGLNLLCALAEQRIREEVVRRHRKRSSSSDSRGSKKKKHKHSKSGKKSKHDKDRKDKKRHRDLRGDLDDIEMGAGSGQDVKIQKEILQEDLKETLDRIKANYMKSSLCKNDSVTHCCREKCNWPTPQELISAMERDMRLKLADITRQCQEKKKELEEIAPILQHRKSQLLSDRESTPVSSKSSVKSFYSERQQQRDLKIDQPSPKWFSENVQTEDIQRNGAAPSDTESYKLDDLEQSSLGPLKKKLCLPGKLDNPEKIENIVTAVKKPINMVGCILSTKTRFDEMNSEKNVFDTKGLLIDENTSVISETQGKIQPANILKVELTETIKKEALGDLPLNESTEAVTSLNLFENNRILQEKRYHRKSSKHHSKHKKSKSSKEKKHRSSEIKERKKKIDVRCLLTTELLDRLENNKIRVLTAMGGLFYAGCLNALQPPDIYAVTLDGERGNRPHIMSREEVLRDAILEVHPASADEIPPGTRICAYWSQQYRCLYPGIIAERETPDVINDRMFVGVEFDDGDNGKIALEDIRFLLSDYPIVEYDPNPLLTLGRRKRRISANDYTTPKSEIVQSSLVASVSGALMPASVEERIKLETSKRECRERKRLKKMRKDKLKKIEADRQDDNLALEKKHKRKHKCGEEYCKHRKHKKRRKHKKHHHKESILDSSQNSSPVNFTESSGGGSISTEGCMSVKSCNLDSSGVASNEIDGEMPSQMDLEKSETDANLLSNKDETTTEEDVASSTTESSESLYEPGKKKERQSSGDNHSKIAAFLPARQLWGWSGKAYRRAGAKGRARKQFYKSIQRGKETITVGDSAVFLSTGRPDRPYIGQIESMWETSSSNKVVKVRWFYHPEETVGCPNLKYPGALFQSPHEDENDVQTISHKCEVMQLSEYTNKFGQDPKQYQFIYDNNDTYYLAGYYDPTVQNLKLQPEIPVLKDNDKWE